MGKETDKCCNSGNAIDDPACCEDSRSQPDNEEKVQPDPSSEPGFEAGIAGDDRAGEQEEGPFSAPEAGACMDALQKAQEQLAQMKQQLSLKDAQMEELLSRFQRLQADFENFRKRTQKEKEEMLQTAAASLVEKILPVMDNFQRAANAAGAEEESFREGVEMIFKQLEKTLSDAGLQQLDCVGKPFDPNLQQAVFRVEDDNLEENTVVEELQKGYLFAGKVIRPSMVKVSCKSSG